MKKIKKFNNKKKRCDFSLRHYQEILKLFKKQNYKFCFFSEAPKQNIKKVYLRHDIDFALEKALCLAEVEHRNKAYSTYFIRLSAPFYNVFDHKNAELIKKIINLGHQLGLHFEGDIYGSKDLTKSKIEKEVSTQFKILKNFFDVKKVVSFHRPSEIIYNRRFKNFINTYEAKFFRETKYLSDSKGKWREGCVCQWLKSSSSPKNMQILLHPVWWARKEKDPQRCLTQYLEEKIKYLDKSIVQDVTFIKRNSLL